MKGLNLASIWKLPVLFVCENNQYATEVAFADVAGNPAWPHRGAAYGLPGVEVDGNDVLAVAQAAGEAVRRARSGGGPTLLECKTYRTRPHAEGMGDFTYRTREEVEQWKARCPIARLKARLLDEGSIKQTELEAIDRELAAQVEEAHRFAGTAPGPPAASATHMSTPSHPRASPPTCRGRLPPPRRAN